MWTHWNGLAIDGSNDEGGYFLSILVRHVKDSGLIPTSLLDMSNINSGSTVQ